jgi:hypothetical protein
MGLTQGVYLAFVSKLITHPKVFEAVEIIEGASDYKHLLIVRYDLEKDFG